MIQALSTREIAKYEAQTDMANICTAKHLQELSDFIIKQSIFKNDATIRCIEHPIYCHPLDTNPCCLPLESQDEYVARRIAYTLNHQWMKTAMQAATVNQGTIHYSVCSLFIYIYFCSFNISI